MPVVILKRYKRRIPVTADGLKAIQENPETRDLYDYPKEAETPEEVQVLKDRKGAQGAAAKEQKDEAAAPNESKADKK